MQGEQIQNMIRKWFRSVAFEVELTLRNSGICLPANQLDSLMKEEENI